MNEFISTVYAEGALLTMWGALLLQYILPLPRSSHPVILWHKFAEILANKVNNNNNYSQSIISGTLGWLLMIIPALLVCIALKPLVWQPQLYELALLILALDWRNNSQLADKLGKALAKEDKAEARKLLKPFVNRETDTLSAVGLGKAGAETIVMGFSRNVIVVLFWYGLLGATGAFIYRLMAELARAWSPSRASFHPFGLPIIRTVAIVEFLPLRLFSLFLIAGSHSAKALHAIKTQSQSWPLPGPAWVLCAIGGKLELALGGPAIYNQQKVIRAKIGGRVVPSALHLSQIHTLLAWRSFIWILLQSMILFAVYQGI